MDRIGCLGLAHVHIVVPDLDEASDFYREVLDFVEMQSHHNLVNRGLSTYYGFGEVWDSLTVSLRFLAWPGILTIKLLKATFAGYGPRSNFGSTQPASGAIYSTYGAGPISVRVQDLDATFAHLSAYAQDYSAKHKISLLSPPVFLSPLLPHQTGATKQSALYGQDEILKQLAEAFPQRAKFQLIDPFGVRWEFNNNVL
jgi:catechol 2,3-dioxygenase-like lactoylglutathione lyase family enzyme